MAPHPAAGPGAPPGTVLGERFRIVRAVGAGGMGIVYEAVDLKLDRPVALKCALPGHRYRLTPEARAAREVSHFNVCKVHELHTFSTPDGELDCLSMEFVEGPTLQRRVDSGVLPAAEALEIARQISAGVGQAHRQGVVHGDLKCGNVILGRAPDGRLRAVVTDFGLARIAGEMRADTVAGGTVAYMAPECFLGEPPTVASDLYALGVLFHVMLTGRAPRRLSPVPEKPPQWTPNSDQATRAMSDSAAQRLLDPLPAPWKKIVTRCLAARPEQRPPSADWVFSAFESKRRFRKAAVAVVLLASLTAAERQWSMRPALTGVGLQILPFEMEGDRSDAAAGIGLDVAERLAGARTKFTVIPPGEAARNLATTPQAARKNLGATHAMQTKIRVAGGVLTAHASVEDLKSGRTLGSPLDGAYSSAETQVLAKALVGTITEDFRLPAGSPRETVSREAYPYYIQGINLLDILQGAVATPLFEKAIDLDPRSALPYAGLAEAAIQRFEKGEGSQLDAAEAAAAKAASINPDAVKVLLAEGFVQQERGQYEKAIRLFTRATEIAPGDAETWRRLSFCYERANRPDDARAACQRAIQAKPDYYRPHLTLGTFYLTRGQFAPAEQEYRRALDAAPGLQSGHMNLGLALLQERQFPEAETQLLEALHVSVKPAANLLLNIGALYYAEERFDQAEVYYAKSIEAGGSTATFFRDLGDADRHLGKTMESRTAYLHARQLVEKEITQDPRRANSHSVLGLLNAFLGDRDRALFELSQGLAINAENRSVIRDSAIAYEYLGMRKESLSVLTRAPRPLLDEVSYQPDVKDLAKDARFQDLLSRASTQ